MVFSAFFMGRKSYKNQILIKLFGAVAQMGERIPRTDEAVGSIPICSTIVSIGLTAVMPCAVM